MKTVDEAAALQAQSPRVRPVRGLDFSPEEVARARQAGALLSIDLELSRRCNLRCVYCYAASGQPLEGELSVDELCDVIDQAAALGARRIVLLGGGEPLLYPGLFEVVAHTSHRGLPCIVFTNGTLITRHVAERLAEYDVDVALKLNSFSPQTQNWLCGADGTAERIASGLAALRQVGYGREGMPDLAIETVICRQNYQEIPDLYRWIRENDFVPYVELLTPQGRAREHDVAISTEEAKALFETLLRVDEGYGVTWTPVPPLVGHLCQRMYFSCCVTSDGNVQPCPGVEVVGGNVRANGLREILNAPIFSAVRATDQHLKGACAACGVSEQCYGCRGAAFQETGDLFAADPICWHARS